MEEYWDICPLLEKCLLLRLVYLFKRILPGITYNAAVGIIIGTRTKDIWTFDFINMLFGRIRRKHSQPSIKSSTYTNWDKIMLVQRNSRMHFRWLPTILIFTELCGATYAISDTSAISYEKYCIYYIDAPSGSSWDSNWDKKIKIIYVSAEYPYN